MKTLNLYYDNNENFIKFIKLNKIDEKKNVLVQVFTSSTDKVFIKNLQELFNENIKNAKVIGTTSDGIIGFNGVTTDDTLISISIFENTEIETAIIEHKIMIFLKLVKKLLKS